MDNEAAAGIIGLLAIAGIGYAIWNHYSGGSYDEDDVYYEEWYYEEWEE